MTAVKVVTRWLTRLDRRKTHGKAGRLAREALLRVRALLLLRDNQAAGCQLSGIRLPIILLLIPVAAGLWPQLRRRRGLTLSATRRKIDSIAWKSFGAGGCEVRGFNSNSSSNARCT